MADATVIGAGLAGCEAAFALAQKGIDVTLIDSKPHEKLAAYHSDQFAELVCSNSLKGERTDTASGLLKAELRLLGSLVLDAAAQTRVEAGGALAVDREAFAQYITHAVCTHPRITVQTGRADAIPADGYCVVATGPLTDGALAASIQTLLSDYGSLFFFDAAAPIIAADSIDMTCAYAASRYDKGGADYINCPLTRDEYTAFRAALATAQEAPLHGFEDNRIYENCMPVEVLARRGEDTLRYGPLRPVGLRDPRTGTIPYAVLQLRKESSAGACYNLVGCQTHLLFAEQKRVFSLIPALRNLDILRYGVMHRNSYLDSPRHLRADFALRKRTTLYFAGQMTGVEGYVESALSGRVAALGLWAQINGRDVPMAPYQTMSGALCRYVANPAVSPFVPMNANFGLLPPLDGSPRLKKKDKYDRLAQRALDAMQSWLQTTL